MAELQCKIKFDRELSEHQHSMNATQYPFARDLITDPQGNVRQVVLDLGDYQRLLAALEDEGLYRAMLETEGEESLSPSEALALLER